MAPLPVSKSPEPIPLRAITLLINYERMISDPRYKGLKLAGTSRGDPIMITGVEKIAPGIWDGEPESVIRRTVHIFAPEPESLETDSPNTTDATDTENPPPTCEIHSYASDRVRALTLAERDLIFHETRAHDGCYNATGMYQDFFALCPEGQEISIQIGNEKPILIDATRRAVLEYTLHSPLHNIRSLIERPGTSSSEPETYTWTSSGASSSENHCVMAFFPSPHTLPSPGYLNPNSNPNPSPNATLTTNENKNKNANQITNKKLDHAIVIDMTRLQYGDAGFGTFGETYFLGPYAQHLSSMENICGELRLNSIVSRTTGRLHEPENQVRVKACATRAWERWHNREKEGWCEYCGRGGKELMRCGGCKVRKVWYCCEVHVKKGWKLHRLSCESVVDKKPVFGPPRKEELK